MIAITSKDGEFIKAVPFEAGKTMGFSRAYGFVSSDAFLERQQNRKRHHFKAYTELLDFKFRFDGDSSERFALTGAENCQIEPEGDGFKIVAAREEYHVANLSKIDQLPIDEESAEKDRSLTIAVLLLLFIPLVVWLLPKGGGNNEPLVIEQVLVQIKPPEAQKPVEIKNALDKIPEVAKQAVKTKRAIQQNLGFLGLLGRKDLKKAMGGVPTDLKDVSPGAGAGGKEGSGGELLVGLGQGLKRTTVGSSGVAGLGGIGTRGAGGGAGGYGSTAIGSGEGKGLTAMALTQELVLEGGLDRMVVQATIQKYLSQVRACYENGLKVNPALGGQVTMAFEINGGGDLNFAKVQKTTLDDTGVEKCITQKMMNWKFPKPRGGVAVKVSYPFVLRSTNS